MKPPVQRLYALLLRLYPADFRRDYAAELALLFADLDRAAAAEGVGARLALWITVLLDLLSSATEERLHAMLKPKPAALISLLLCLPLLFMLISATLNIEPAFVRQANQWMFNPDGTSTLAGKIVMLALLLSLPAAFVINLLGMLRRAPAESVEAFRVTPLHTGVGGAILLSLLLLVQGQIAHELAPFVTPLGAAAPLARLGFLLLLTIPSLALLLNRLPRLAPAEPSGRGLHFAPQSLNLIMAAALLLMILILLSAFALEVGACSIGVPNCD